MNFSKHPSREMGIEFLTWVNAELRKQAERRAAEAAAERFRFVEKVKTYVIAGLSSVSAVLIGLLSP